LKAAGDVLTTAFPGQEVMRGLVQDNGPFALASATVEGREQIVFRHAPRILPEIFRKARLSTKKIFLVNDQETVTHEELYRRAASYAALFANRGIRQGMRVALALSNEGDWIAAFIALVSMGATALLADQIVDCDAAIAEFERQGRCVFVGAVELAAARTAPHPPLPALQFDPGTDACIAFTSGSSGMPKGAVLTHRSLVTGMMNILLDSASTARTAPGSRPVMAKAAAPSVLLRTPLNHVSGYMQLLLMFMLGGTIVRSERKDIVELIKARQITSVTGISDQEISALLKDAAKPELGSLRSIATAGREMPPSLRLALRSAWPDLGLGTGYGLTETCGLVCAIGNQELDERPSAAGRLLPTVESRIVGTDLADCPAGEPGEIWLRGAMMMRGYCNVPGHRMPGGWFATGDIGVITDDGMLHVLDRADRFLRLGRQRISCREIEEVVRSACRVGEVAALPLAHGANGDGLLIVLGGNAYPDMRALKNLLASRFSEIPEPRFANRDMLPRTRSGKIAYAQLLAEAGS
jgi:acyl-CoA synthetase (AMP-forming)/AMP-acid ligase II